MNEMIKKYAWHGNCDYNVTEILIIYKGGD